MGDGVNEQELRDMIRASIARHLEAPRPAPTTAPDPASAFRAQISHLRFALAQGGDGDGACLIEPAVRCNHCGYCQSYGH
jgi:hypothetical protein